MPLPNKNKLSGQNGQGLLEVTISLTIISMGLLAIFSFITSNLTAIRRDQGNLVALNLARESLEVVRSIRDDNWLAIESGAKNSSDWDDGLYGGSKDYTGITEINEIDSTWQIKWSPNNINSCRANSQCRVYFKDNLYRQSISNIVGATPLTFYRLVQVNPICDLDPEVIVIDGQNCADVSANKIGIQTIAEVQWEHQGTIKTVTIEDKLYNWK